MCDKIKGLSIIKQEDKNKMSEELKLHGEQDNQPLFTGGFDCGYQEEPEKDKYSYKLAKMHEKYSFKEYLGVGVYSDVRKAVNNFTQESFAVKILKKIFIKKEKTALRPILENLMMSEHKNITKVIEYFQDKCYYYIVYEYNPGGMVLDYI